MPHRDPETGQFVTSVDTRGFRELETLRAFASGRIDGGSWSQTSDSDFGEGVLIEGQELVDFGEVLDRNEVGRILEAHHWLTAYMKYPSQQADAATLRAVAEFSASPALQVGHALDIGAEVDGETEQPPGQGDVAIDTDWQLELTEDTRDIIGRPLAVVNQSAVNLVDLTNGVGVGQAATFNADRWSGTVPDFEVDDRDEVYLNAVLEVDGAEAIPDHTGHIEVSAYYVIGVGER